jgi:hypothetical protein
MDLGLVAGERVLNPWVNDDEIFLRSSPIFCDKKLAFFFYNNVAILFLQKLGSLKLKTPFFRQIVLAKVFLKC